MRTAAGWPQKGHCMLLRGTEYPNVWVASGTNNFFFNGYPYHETIKKWFCRISKFLPTRFKLEFSFVGAVETAKTVTFEGREGNMPLRDEESTMPKEFFPKCIWVNVWSWLMAASVNAVGLTNRGLKWTLDQGEWQRWPERFCISYSPTGQAPFERATDALRFMQMFKDHLREFRFRPALQINLSCPNTREEFYVPEEGRRLLGIFAELGVPLIIKVNILEPIATLMDLEQHPALDAVSFSNTIPFYDLPWHERLFYFGRLKSVLARRGFGPGGASGRPLFRRVLAHMIALRKAGFKKIVLAGGGILGPRNAIQLLEAGADGVVIGSITFLRPWRLQKTIQAAFAGE